MGISHKHLENFKIAQTASSTLAEEAEREKASIKDPHGRTKD